MDNETINTTNTTETGAENTETGSEQTTFTKEETLNLIQSESDKRVQQALKTQQKKYEAELNKQKSLVGLDAEQRAKAENEMKFKELEEQLSQYKLADTKNQIIQVLTERNMSASLADFIVTTDDITECQAKIDKLDKIIKASVKAEVERRMNTSTPKANIGGMEGLTKEQFNKLSITEQTELFTTNPELYRKLTA